jgi:hypothetical protein
VAGVWHGGVEWSQHGLDSLTIPYYFDHMCACDNEMY